MIWLLGLVWIALAWAQGEPPAAGPDAVTADAAHLVQTLSEGGASPGTLVALAIGWFTWEFRSFRTEFTVHVHRYAEPVLDLLRRILGQLEDESRPALAEAPG